MDQQHVEGAVEIVKQLRREGVEAYYYHGPAKSIVTVGTFDESAMYDDPKLGQKRYNRDVLRLMHSREDFKYNTEWLQKVVKRRNDGPPVVQRSLLVAIPRRDVIDEWELQ